MVFGSITVKVYEVRDVPHIASRDGIRAVIVRIKLGVNVAVSSSQQAQNVFDGDRAGEMVVHPFNQILPVPVTNAALPLCIELVDAANGTVFGQASIPCRNVLQRPYEGNLPLSCGGHIKLTAMLTLTPEERLRRQQLLQARGLVPPQPASTTESPVQRPEVPVSAPAIPATAPPAVYTPPPLLSILPPARPAPALPAAAPVAYPPISQFLSSTASDLPVPAAAPAVRVPPPASSGPPNGGGFGSSTLLKQVVGGLLFAVVGFILLPRNRKPTPRAVYVVTHDDDVDDLVPEELCERGSDFYTLNKRVCESRDISPGEYIYIPGSM